MNKPADEVRRDVSKAYAEAVKAPAKGGCCCSTPAQKGAAVQLGGYSGEELAALPDAAVVNSFGCGNPVALAGLGPGEVVLDLGSGAGIDLFLAAEKVGPTGRVIGVDMTDAMIAKANENIRAGNYTNVEVRKGLIEDLPVESGSVDWVISNCVINLSPEKPRVFREIARVLKPGGRMLVSDIVAKDLPAQVREVAELYSSCISGAISEEEYLGGLRDAGLVDAEVRDRLVYDADQLEGIAASDLESACCCGPGKAELTAIARTLAGKVWSAKLYAKKPA
jgi:SAM-dependent methyltransferase